MAKSKGPKVYAVACGRTPGIYSTWSECQAQTTGFPRAIFKSFKTNHEAQAFIQSNSSSNASSAWSTTASASRADAVPITTSSSSSNQSKKRSFESAAASKRQKKVAAANNPQKQQQQLSQQCDAQLQIKIHFDGGSRGNPGVAGAGAEVVVVSNMNNNNNSAGAASSPASTTTTTYLAREYCGVKETNNYAEYKGLLAGLKQAKVCIEQYHSSKKSAPSTTPSLPRKPVFQLQVYGDSNLIIQQLKGAWQCKHPNLRPLFQQSQQLIGDMRKMDSMSEVLYGHVYREHNKVADELANEAMDQRKTWMTSTTDGSSVENIPNDNKNPAAALTVSEAAAATKKNNKQIAGKSSKHEVVDVDGSDDDSHLSC